MQWTTCISVKSESYPVATLSLYGHQAHSKACQNLKIFIRKNKINWFKIRQSFLSNIQWKNICWLIPFTLRLAQLLINSFYFEITSTIHFTLFSFKGQTAIGTASFNVALIPIITIDEYELIQHTTSLLWNGEKSW